MKYFEGIRRLLFGEEEPEVKEERQDDLVDTAPLPVSIVDTVRGDLRWGGYSAGSAQVIGHQRKENEDSLLILTTSEIGEDSLPEFGLFCIADGAGGHGHGEIASALALNTVARYLIKEQFLFQLDSLSRNNTQSAKELMHRAFELSDSNVSANAKGGVTTLTVALLHGNHLTIGHVGDTRAYLINGGRIQLATRDHSVPWRLVEIGQLTPEEAREHPQRNLLWNAIGKGENLFVDVFTYPVPIGGYLLLCSDGLWSEITDSQLQQMIQKLKDPYRVCEEMVQQADFSNGSDNITAVLVAFSEDYGKECQTPSMEYFPGSRS
jgi:serine/threonine protein phosphatase PrpC